MQVRIALSIPIALAGLSAAHAAANDPQDAASSPQPREQILIFPPHPQGPFPDAEPRTDLARRGDQGPFYPDAPGPFPVPVPDPRPSYEDVTAELLPPLEDPIPFGIPKVGPPIALEPVLGGLNSPVWAISAPGLPAFLFTVDQTGQVYATDVASGVTFLFFDISSRLVALGPFDERGLLGLAFHPDYLTNGLLYTYTSEPATQPADYSTMPPGVAPDHQSVILEWIVPNPMIMDPPPVFDPAPPREILRIDQPQANHNAGCLAFGPDGMLFVSLGDGGGADDRDGQLFNGVPMVGHGLEGNGQDPTNPLGSILRIDPLGGNSPNGAYGIPGDNPFFGQDRLGALDEIWAYGLRNPFRFSFDIVSGRMLLADAGQNDIEEVDFGMPGANYGWRVREGSFRFVHNGNEPGYVVEPQPLAAGLVDPLVQYDHDEGVAVVGGFVHRGPGMAFLNGFYVFGDYSGRLFVSDGRAMGELRIEGQASLDLNITGFGQDAAGEVYVLVNDEFGPFGRTGQVLRLAPSEL